MKTELKQNGVIYKMNKNNSKLNDDKNNIAMLNFEDLLSPGIYNLYIRSENPINIVEDYFGIPNINENGDKG